MKFGFIGVSYKLAPLDVRDCTSFTDTDKINFMQKAEEQGICQCMVLSTCNRSEVYYFSLEPDCEERLIQLYQEQTGVTNLADYLVCLREEEAYSYLFRVAAGLESLVLGEDQILGQVKEALDFARTMGHSGKEMNHVVRDAITCAKKMKTELRISEHPLSVSYIGILEVNRLVGIEGKRCFVIGSGKTAHLALTYLYEYGAGEVTACSRTFAHARSLKNEFAGLRVVEFEERYEIMKDCDIVISATASPHRVLKREGAKIEKPVMILDLATPRDVDIKLREESNVTLVNLDDLEVISRKNQKKREELVSLSGQQIQEAVNEARQWLLSSRMDSTIESLQQRVGEIVEDSYEYLDRKMELSHREQKLLKKVLNASLQRMMREPIQELKQLDSKEEQDAYQQIVGKLFQI